MIGDVSGHGARRGGPRRRACAWRGGRRRSAASTSSACCPRCSRCSCTSATPSEIFATVCTVTITPDRASAAVRSAGHPPPAAARRRRRRADGRADGHRAAAGVSTRRAGRRARWRCPRLGAAALHRRPDRGPRRARPERRRLGLERARSALVWPTPAPRTSWSQARALVAALIDDVAGAQRRRAARRHRRDPAAGVARRRRCAPAGSARAVARARAGLLAVATLVGDRRRPARLPSA